MRLKKGNRDPRKNVAEKGEPQLQKKRGRLTPLCVINEAENGDK